MSESVLTATVELMDGMAFQADTGSGHSLALDAAPEVGGGDCGPGPMEMLLLRGVRASEHPKVFTAIFVEHVVSGRGVSEESVRRAVELSANCYCSAGAMLSKVAHITESYRIVDVATGQEQSGALAVAA